MALKCFRLPECELPVRPDVVPRCRRGDAEVVEQLPDLLYLVWNGLQPAPFGHLFHGELGEPCDLAGETFMLGLAGDLLPVPGLAVVPEGGRSAERAFQLNGHVLRDRRLTDRNSDN